MSGKKSAYSSQVKQLGVLTSIPIILLIGPVIGYLAGSWIDRKAHIFPWFTTILVLLGFVGSGREVVRLLREVLKDADANDKL